MIIDNLDADTLKKVLTELIKAKNKYNTFELKFEPLESVKMAKKDEFDEEVKRIARKFYLLVKENYKKHDISITILKRINKNNWLKDINTILNRGFKESDFDLVFKMIAKTPHYTQNIRSTSKLKQRFEEVLLSAKQKKFADEKLNKF